jgi:hypothetical protein
LLERFLASRLLQKALEFTDQQTSRAAGHHPAPVDIAVRCVDGNRNGTSSFKELIKGDTMDNTTLLIIILVILLLFGGGYYGRCHWR